MPLCREMFCTYFYSTCMAISVDRYMGGCNVIPVFESVVAQLAAFLQCVVLHVPAVPASWPHLAQIQHTDSSSDGSLLMKLLTHHVQLKPSPDW